MRSPFTFITARQSFGFGALVLCAGFTGSAKRAVLSTTPRRKSNRARCISIAIFVMGTPPTNRAPPSVKSRPRVLFSTCNRGTPKAQSVLVSMHWAWRASSLTPVPTAATAACCHPAGKNPRGSADQYAKLGLTAKVRVSQSVLKYGALLPDVPLLKYNDGRLLPTMFNGAMLTSKEVKDLTFMAARLDKYTARDSTDSQDIRVHCKNKRYACNITADHFDMYGFDYKINDRLTGQYHYAELEDIYRQHFVGLLANQPLGGGVLKADLRLLKSADSGAARAGSIDNRALSAMLAYAISGHTFSAGWQRMNGDNSMPYLDGSNPYLVNYVQVNDFAAAQERSWQLRYDYDFKAIGLNGLTFLTRYVNGDHIKVPGSDQEGKEWERDSELKYVVQSGTFKDVSLRLRNATYRTNYEKFARDVDETRLIVSYNFSVL